MYKFASKKKNNEIKLVFGNRNGFRRDGYVISAAPAAYRHRFRTGRGRRNKS